MVNIRNLDGVNTVNNTKNCMECWGEKQANCDDNRALEFEEVH